MTPAIGYSTSVLTPAQQGIWLSGQALDDPDTYAVAELTEITGPFDAPRWIAAATAVLAATTVLRMRYEPTPEGLARQFADASPPVPETIDLRGEDAPRDRAARIIAEALATPCDLASGVTTHACLLILSDSHAQWLLRIHHLALDGYGFALVGRQIAEAYRRGGGYGAAFGDYEALLSTSLAYEDSVEAAADRSFWATRSPIEPPVGLLGSTPDPGVEVERLRAPSADPAVALAALAVLTASATQRQDVVIGVHVMCRGDRVSLTTPATVQNLLPIRLRVDPSLSTAEFLDEVRAEFDISRKHQRYRHEWIRRDRGLRTHEPLADAYLNITPFGQTHRLGEATARSHALWDGPVDGLTLGTSADGLAISAPGGPDRRPALAGCADALSRLLGAFDDPAGSVAQLELTAPPDPSRERREPDAVAAIGALTRVASMDASAPLISAPDGDIVAAEAAAAVAVLCRALRRGGIGPGALVGVLVPRGSWILLAPLAVLESGAAFVPLDPNWPAQRLIAVAETARLAAVVAYGACADTVTAELPHIALVNPEIELARASAADRIPITDSDRRRAVVPRDLAYVLFTSGSTGTPKGVVIEHRNFAQYLSLIADHYLPRLIGERSRRLRVGHQHPYTFDSSMSPLAMMLAGHHVVIPDESVLRVPARNAEYLAANRVDLIDLSPAVLAELLDAGLVLGDAGVSAVMIGGDACSPSVWDRLRSSAAMCGNAYGPTENTVDATLAWTADHDTPSIGASVPGQWSYVLDAALRPVPAGIGGELYLAGPGVARGYLGAPALTAARFVPDPYGGIGARMYRTGDLVRRASDGSMTFLGRADGQLSVRGVRVESGEVERALVTLPGVTDAVAMVRDDGRGPRLVAYVVLESGNRLGDPRSQLRALLPSASLPSAVVAIDAFPLTARGKVDRSALPAPADDLGAGEHWAEMSVRQRQVAAAFADVLDLDVHDLRSGSDLFALGGHSLTAARLLGRLGSAAARLDLRQVFADPTIAGLADRIGAVGEPGAGGSTPERHGPVLTDAQRRLWFLAQASGPSATYNIPLLLRFDEPFDAEALVSSVAAVITQHRTLRTRYPVGRDGQPVLHVLTADAAVAELTVCERADLESGARKAFDVAREIPLRLYLAPDGAAALLVIHHIAADGWSVGPIIESIAEAYETARSGAGACRLPEADDELVVASDHAAAVEYWRQSLAGAPEEIDLPADRGRPAVRSTEGGELLRAIPAIVAGEIESAARAQGATPFMLIGAALAATLARSGGGSDLVLGTVSSGRATAADERAVTFIANTLALRIDAAGDPSLGELVGRFRDVALSGLAHADAPFDAVVEAVNPPRAAHRHPLFQVMLVVQNEPQASWPGVTVEVIGNGTAKFDLTCEIQFGVSGMSVRWEYARDLFDSATIERFAGWFEQLLTATVHRPQSRLWESPLGVAPTAVVPTICSPREPSLVHALLAAFDRHADRGALTVGDRTLSYRDLGERATVIAHRLLAAGVSSGELVAVALPRSPDQVAAIIGVLLAGAAYVPLDPASPSTRLVAIVDDARPTALVRDTSATVADVSAAFPDLPVIDLAGLSVAPRPPVDPPLPLPDEAAYVIFTSGSTGRPKGVRVTHRNVLRLFAATRRRFDFGSDDVWTLFHSYAFDFAVWEIFGALLHGGRLVMVEHDVSRSPAEFAALLVRERVTVLNQTPSAFAQLIVAERDLSEELALRVVILGGEPMDPAVLPDWFSRHPPGAPELVNMYGITETTVHVTYQLVDESTLGSSPVGVPLDDLGVSLLDAGLHPVPPGVVGEVYVRGAGLADGYLGRSGLTATRFVADPIGESGTRMYRSGDLAVQRPDGTLDFRGRADRQVQLRGFRIELGEVEAAAMALDGVDQALARVLRVGAGDERLVLYVVGPDPAVTDPVELRRVLRGALPTQMVPGSVLVLPAFPLTVNGKLDTAALPHPNDGRRRGGRPPANPAEAAIVRHFAETLGLDEVGVDESFFDLGGHSMLAVRLVAGLRGELGIDIGVGSLVTAPTPALLAAELDGGDPDSALHTLLPLRATGEAPGVFCIHPAGGLSWCYAGLAKHLPADTPLYGLQARGVLRPDSQPTSLADMADEYIAQLKAVQSTGPYHLVGWSLGGMVAHVMAARLAEAGDRVGLVALLDAYPSQAETGIEEPPIEDALSALLAMAGLEDSVLGERAPTLDAVAQVLGERRSPMAGLTRERLEALLRTYRNTARVLREYAHERYRGDVLFLEATRAGIGPAHDPAEWSAHIDGELEIIPVDCTHREMTLPGPLAQLGELLSERLHSHR